MNETRFRELVQDFASRAEYVKDSTVEFDLSDPEGLSATIQFEDWRGQIWPVPVVPEGDKIAISIEDVGTLAADKGGLYAFLWNEASARLEDAEPTKRTKACVKACKGISNKELEWIADTGGMTGPREDIAKLAKQRDDLLAALGLIETDRDGDGFICHEAMEQVRDAIAAAGGGQ
ncbi:MAG: hypothetical protein KJ558_10150 [Gammaproteobacteria bacterium]|nr:hypothetical protein [Gammaproteobacteria bacterium]MBU1655168.1 hypothetical protein [Gammaproteobacteria bacterium]MBU1959979.1 hypothetical protein [Gammaproteobacteria bacterium]